MKLGLKNGMGIVCLIVLWASAVSAAAIPVFGPQRFDKPKGSPAHYSATFVAPDPAGSYTLRVESGSDGLQQVKNVSVAVNGVELVDSTGLRAANPASRALVVQGNNSLDVVLKGQGGNFVTVTVDCEGCRILRITSPSAETPVHGVTTVRGEVLNPLGSEVGITVNGVVAQVDSNRFVANHVPIPVENPQLLVRAVFADGRSYEERQPVLVYNGTPALTLRADRQSGLAPLSVTLSATLDNTEAVSIDCAGPQVTLGDRTTTTVAASLEQAGLYTCTATTLSGLHDSVDILVYDRAALDTLLQGKWTGMKQALQTGDTATALQIVTNERREAWRTVFVRLADKLPSIFAAPEELSFVKATENAVEYDNLVVEGDVIYSYPVRFVRDADGILRLEQF